MNSCSLHLGDCLEVMATLEAGSIDAIITDLPYGTTACKWDAVIPFAPLWEQVRRVLKPNGVFVTTASQPFTSALVLSRPDLFRYALVWAKTRNSHPFFAKVRPLPQHEDVLVFGDGQLTYNPQMVVADRPYTVNLRTSGRLRGDSAGDKWDGESEQRSARYPTSVIPISNPSREAGMHPTQKPVELMRYLIRTYTSPGETVLDPCCGSGTTGVAAQLEGRNCVLIEREEKYLEITRQRLEGTS